MPGSIPQASPHRAGCESGSLTNYSVKPKSFSNPRDYETSEPLLGRASGGTWKVFTFVEGPVSVKDDRASASENQVCMGFFLCFFFPSKHSNSQEVRYSARQKSRSASDGDVVVGEPGVGRAPSCLSGLWCLPTLDSLSLAKMTPVSDLFMGSS